MRTIYSYNEGMKPIYISNSQGRQRVLLVLEDGLDYIVYFADDYTRQSFINIIINKTSGDMYNIANFKRIENDDQFNYYDKWITERYNYNAIHVDEKITGEDQGGPVLWLPDSAKDTNV